MTNFNTIIDNIYYQELDVSTFDSEYDEIYRNSEPFVSIEQFLDDDYYFGKIAKDLYPDNRPDLEDIFNPEKNYIEIILGGAIGWGKTFLATIALCYMIGQLSAYLDPHRWLGASPTSPLVFINMSINAKKAKEVIFTRVKTMMDSCPYFNEQFPRNRRLIDTLEWNIKKEETGKRGGQQIIFKPGTGESLAALGDDIYGGACDELNFFRIVEKSKRAFGETFDPAQKLYDTISRRMKSRFLSGGVQLGKLFLISSAQIPLDFIEKRVREAEANGSLGDTIKYIRKSQWQGKKGVFVAGKPVYSNKSFRVEVGTAQRSSRLLDKVIVKTGEVIPIVKDESSIKGKIITPPIDLWSDFYTDLDGSIRDFGGEVTRAINPFFTSVEPIYESVNNNLQHPWMSEHTTLQDGMRLVVEKLFIKDETGKWRAKRHPKKPRYWHIDISLSGDAMGLSIVHCAGWKQVRSYTEVEDLPIVETDLMLKIKPPRGGEINFGNVRAILYHLQSHGMFLRYGSLDLKLMSADFMQIVETKGLQVAHQSVDRDFTAYQVLKDCFYSGRMKMYAYPPIIDELIKLEKRERKIDHPADGSKDVSDSLAGAVFNLFEKELKMSPKAMEALLPSRGDTIKKDSSMKKRVSEETENFRKLIRGGKIVK